MCLTGALLRSVLVVLLLANSCAKRRCNYKEILGSYREVIFVELQNLLNNIVEVSIFWSQLQIIKHLGEMLEYPMTGCSGPVSAPVFTAPNLTGSSNISKERDPCPSGKARRILISIYGMTQQMRCQRGGKQQPDLEKPLESMEQLITHNCSPDYLGKKTSCSAVKKIKGKKRKRIRLIKVIKALITCWQKLQSVYRLSK